MGSRRCTTTRTSWASSTRRTWRFPAARSTRTWCLRRSSLTWGTSVDVELVAFRVLHPDRVVVEPFLGQCSSDGGAQAGQPAGLGVGSLPASLDLVRPLATRGACAA